MNSAILQARCPKCGGEVHERDRTFHCPACNWALFKTVLGRTFQVAEVESLLAEGRTGLLEGFRNRQGRLFNACLKLGSAPDFKWSFEFAGQDAPGHGTGDSRSAAAAPDFTGQKPVGACPLCGASVFETTAAYACEKSHGSPPSCRFRIRKVILERAVAPAELLQLLENGRTDLLKGFVSRKNGRPFDACLVVQDGGVAFEFAARPGPPSPSGPAEEVARSPKRSQPAERWDFTGQSSLGKCPKCGARVFETGQDYVCEHGQRSPNPCGFRTGRTILEQPVSRDQMTHLLAEGRSELLSGFVSRKSGRPFAAFLVLGENGQVSFEFPPRAAPRAVVGG